MSSILYSNPQKLDKVVFAPGTFQLSSFSIFLGFSALTYIHTYIITIMIITIMIIVYIYRERDIIPKQIEYGALRDMYLGISIWVRGYWNVCVLSTPRWLYYIYMYTYIYVYICIHIYIYIKHVYIYVYILSMYWFVCHILSYLLSYVHMLHTHLTFLVLFIAMNIMINH